MKKDLLMWDETIFKDPDLLELDHIPEYFAHRDTQMHTLMYCIKPALRGGRPVNVQCIGSPGTGKTTAVHKLFEEIEKVTSKVIPVYINCQANSTRYTVFSQIFKKLFNHSPPSSGVSFHKINDKITQHLADEEKVLVTALDDVNYLFHEGEHNNVLYSLIRAHETNPGARIGVISILSDTGTGFHLDPKVESVFLPEEIRFPRYTTDEIRDILDNRVRMGFFPNVVAPSVLDAVVEYAELLGDLRVGIDLLKRSGLSAERQASRTISREDVKNSYETSKLVHLTYLLKSLKNEETTLLELISGLPDITAGELYKAFHEKTGLGYTRYYETLEKLLAIKLVDTDFTGKGTRGRSRIIKLKYGAEEIRKRLGK
ncbi:MAG: ORC1-type DNA replication protein [ANME-2 cluster archaeon]|nr:ORC1-type DNA replication protein [ANME-2 cluster archaeon]